MKTRAIQILFFLWKDIKTELSYKLAFAGFLLGHLFQLVIFYFMSQIFNDSFNSYLAPYGNNYFNFILGGIALMSFISLGINSLAQNIREAQLQGTIEVIFSMHTDPSTVALGMSSWPLAKAVLTTLILLAGGVFIFDANVRLHEPVTILLLLALTATAHMAVGIIAACLVLKFKRVSLVSALSMTSILGGGIFYPVEVMPAWAAELALLLPITHASAGMRKALLMTDSTAAVGGETAFLAVFTVLTLPASLACFHLTVQSVRNKGTLLQY